MVVIYVDNGVLKDIREENDTYELKDGEFKCEVTFDEETKLHMLKMPDDVIEKIGNIIPEAVDIDDKEYKPWRYNIDTIEVPDSVKDVEKGFFQYFGYLNYIRFGKDSQLINIGDFAFENCQNLMEITLPEMKNGQVGQEIFKDCYIVRKMIFPGGTYSYLKNDDSMHDSVDEVQDDVTFYRELISSTYRAVERHWESNELKNQDLQNFCSIIAKREAKKLGMSVNVILGGMSESPYLSKLDEFKAVIANGFINSGNDIKKENVLTYYIGNCSSASVAWSCLGRMDTMQNDTIFDMRTNFTHNDSVISQNGYKGLVYWFFHSILHEMTHLRQHMKLNTGVCSLDNLLLAKDHLVLMHQRPVYEALHNSFYMEQDANINANAGLIKYKRIADLTGKHEFSGLDRSCKFAVTEEVKGKEQVKLFEDVIADVCDEIVKSKGGIKNASNGTVSVSKILEHEYTTDGEKRTPEDVIKRMKEEIERIEQLDGSIKDDQKQNLVNDIKMMFFEILYRRMQEYPQEKVAALGELYNPQDKQELYEEMSNYFQSKIDKLRSDVWKYYTFTPVGYSTAIKLLKEKSNYLKSFIPKECVHGLVSEGLKTTRASMNPLKGLTNRIKSLANKEK